VGAGGSVEDSAKARKVIFFGFLAVVLLVGLTAILQRSSNSTAVAPPVVAAGPTEAQCDAMFARGDGTPACFELAAARQRATEMSQRPRAQVVHVDNQNGLVWLVAGVAIASVFFLLLRARIPKP
jgi:hypothetical protein